jgi:alpha-L-rhamnosidase
MHVTSVRFEHHREPLGIGQSQPRVSWTTLSEATNWRQSAYEIEMASAADPHQPWSSGRINSAESVLVPWPGTPLESRERRRVRVRVWGTAGSEPSAWSDWHDVEAGLLRPDDWTAQLISPAWDEDSSMPQPAVAFRHDFRLDGTVAAARLYVTAHGVYEMQINGSRVGDHVLAPGWTSYHHRLRYQTYDVTALLKDGSNGIGATVGEGWYRGRLGWGDGKRNIYGDRAGLIAQLEIQLVDGRSVLVATDGRWRCGTGPVVSSEIYDGETYDARLEQPDWSRPEFDDAGLSAVDVRPVDLTALVAPDGPPIRRTQTVSPVDVTTIPSGKTVVDFGQNLVGRVRIRVRGESGQAVTIRHAEVLEDGELGVRPLRRAKATDRYILKGGGPEEWEPLFTFHGFRYAEVEGWPGELDADDIVAVVCHTDMERTGWFEASEPMLERLHENVIWSMRGNFLDVPTDCPQRDERLGWTGDIQVFAPTGTFLYNCAGILTSWLRDLSAEQLAAEDQMPPLVVPDILDWKLDAAAWGDAAVMVPWTIYERFGDAEVLRAQFASMKAWVDGAAAKAGERGVWDSEWQFGDWLDPTAPPTDPGAAQTDVGLVATAYLARSAEVVSKAAALIGDDAAEAAYASLAARVREAFNDEYVTPTGRMACDTQTAFALAIEFHLLAKPEQRARAGRRLADLVHAGHYRIGTGFVGTPIIADALCSVGETQLAYRLLLETSCPSFLYPLTMGATTIWERWDSMLPDGSINPGEMTSFNHYALGAVADWLHRTVAGLAPGAPGYRRLIVAPRPGGDLTRAAAAHETPYGRASVAWELIEGSFMLDVVVPANCTASVFLPGSDEPVEVGSGRHEFRIDHQPAPYPPVPRVTRPRVEEV